MGARASFFFTIACAESARAAAPVCLAMPTETVASSADREVTSSRDFPAGTSRRYRIFRLSRGGAARTYRLVPRDGRLAFQIIKVYRDERSLDDDLQRFDAWTWLLEGTSLLVPAHRKISPTQMRLRDVPGERLDVVLAKSPDLARRAGSELSIAIATAERRLRALGAAGVAVAASRDSLNAVYPGHDDVGPLEIKLGPGSVVVDADARELILFDP